MNKTLDYYNDNAEKFKIDTINVEFEEKQEMLLKYLNKGDKILDLGCGVGRDSKAFINKEYNVVALDGSKELCKIASENIGQVVINKKFEELDYENEFDGIWACASLLHVRYDKLEEILKKVIKALKTNSYFYASFKYGEFEGERNGRYFTDFTERKFEKLISNFDNLKIVEMEITSDARVGRENEKWLNIIMKKK